MAHENKQGPSIPFPVQEDSVCSSSGGRTSSTHVAQLNERGSFTPVQPELAQYAILCSSSGDGVKDQVVLTQDLSPQQAVTVGTPFPLQDGSEVSLSVHAPAGTQNDCKFGLAFPTNSNDVIQGKISAGTRQFFNDGTPTGLVLPLDEPIYISRAGNSIYIKLRPEQEPLLLHETAKHKAFLSLTLTGRQGTTAYMHCPLRFEDGEAGALKEIASERKEMDESLAMLEMNLEESGIALNQVFPFCVMLLGLVQAGKSALVNTISNAVKRHFSQGCSMNRPNRFAAITGHSETGHVTRAMRQYDLGKPSAVNAPATILDTFGCPSAEEKWDPYFKVIAATAKGSLDPRVNATNFASIVDSGQLEREEPVAPRATQIPSTICIVLDASEYENREAWNKQLRFLDYAVKKVARMCGKGVPQCRIVIVLTGAEKLDIRFMHEDVQEENYNHNYRACKKELKNACEMMDSEVLPIVNYVRGADPRGSAIRDLHAMRVLKACVESAVEWMNDVVENPAFNALLRNSPDTSM